MQNDASTKQSNGGIDYEESEEFEMEVPPGSVLLFPSEKSVGVEEINFEVTNLIVSDGTWAKVRHQPRAGYLSAIKSIVYSLKAVGENPEGLDGLLDVFASMVGDQSRCKDERLSKAANLVRVKW